MVLMAVASRCSRHRALINALWRPHGGLPPTGGRFCPQMQSKGHHIKVSPFVGYHVDRPEPQILAIGHCGHTPPTRSRLHAAGGGNAGGGGERRSGQELRNLLGDLSGVHGKPHKTRRPQLKEAAGHKGLSLPQPCFFVYVFVVVAFAALRSSSSVSLPFCWPSWCRWGWLGGGQSSPCLPSAVWAPDLGAGWVAAGCSEVKSLPVSRGLLRRGPAVLCRGALHAVEVGLRRRVGLVPMGLGLGQGTTGPGFG